MTIFAAPQHESAMQEQHSTKSSAMNPRLEQLRSMMPFLFGLILLLNLTHANAIPVTWHPDFAGMAHTVAVDFDWYTQQMTQYEQNGALYYAGN